MAKVYYDLNPSQEVVKLQCKYTLFKRVINIVFSSSVDYELDFDLMQKAFNIVVQRNDCLRIRFKTIKGKLKQYFEKEVIFDNIERLSFDTKEKQDQFIKSISKHAIKYKKGEVVIPYFIKTYDNKYMVLLKICHLIIDIHGLNFLFNDLFDVYDSLLNNKEFPPMPYPFEEIVKHDLSKKENKQRYNENREFFKNYLANHDEPYYAGVHGPNEPIWKKQLQKGKRAMKMFFVQNDTVPYEHKIGGEIINKAIEFSKKYQITLTNVFFYACSLTCSILNNNVTSMLPLQLCNCRTSLNDRNCAGTKVQSIGCFTEVDYEKSFVENLNEFTLTQLKLYRRINFSDQDFEMLVHNTYKSSMLESYYSITFSFVPYNRRKDVTYNLYSNGKGALPCYLVLLYDVNSNEIRMGYDVQKKITSEQDVLNFHNRYLKMLNDVLDNPELMLKESIKND